MITPTTLKPAAARTYEPEAFATHTTATNVEQLFKAIRQFGGQSVALECSALIGQKVCELPECLLPCCDCRSFCR